MEACPGLFPETKWGCVAGPWSSSPETLTVMKHHAPFYHLNLLQLILRPGDCGNSGQGKLPEESGLLQLWECCMRVGSSQAGCSHPLTGENTPHCSPLQRSEESALLTEQRSKPLHELS